MSVQRRLAAILAADVVGYTRLMGADEAGTRARFNALLDEAVKPAIAAHRGRLVKTMGDGFLVELASVVDAVQCAADIQAGAAEMEGDEAEDRRMRLRVGIHLGDVIVEGDDIHGDGVNIAARLEALAAPGGICVSDMVHAGVRGKLALDFTELGEQSLKNIAEPVRVFGVRLPVATSTSIAPGGAMKLPLPDKPSIAVLPFQNMSGDPEQEYFSDGITEDIITAFSRIRQFFVIARNTTFTYKGRAVNVQAVAAELGVRYVLEGSVRKAGDRLRITAQLIDGASGNHIWAERYDRELEDVFAVQDDITRTVVGAIGPQLEAAEYNRARAVQPDDLGAWELYLQGSYHVYQRVQGERQHQSQAAEYFEKAISIDPGFSRAWSGLGRCYYNALILGQAGTRFADTERAMEVARRAVELDRDDSVAHWVLGSIYTIRRESEAALRELRLATELNPSDAMAYQVLGVTLIYAGDPVAAESATGTALRLSPRDPQMPVRQMHLAFARLHQEDFDGAVELARTALQDPTAPYSAQSVLVAALGHQGRLSEAAREIAELRRRIPDFKVETAGKLRPYTDDRARDQYLDGLRKAGLPE